MTLLLIHSRITLCCFKNQCYISGFLRSFFWSCAALPHFFPILKCAFVYFGPSAFSEFLVDFRWFLQIAKTIVNSISSSELDITNIPYTPSKKSLMNIMNFIIYWVIIFFPPEALWHDHFHSNQFWCQKPHRGTAGIRELLRARFHAYVHDVSEINIAFTQYIHTSIISPYSIRFQKDFLKWNYFFMC